MSYNSSDHTLCLPNLEVRMEILEALRNSRQHRDLSNLIKASDRLLQSTIVMDEVAVAEAMEYVHKCHTFCTFSSHIFIFRVIAPSFLIKEFACLKKTLYICSAFRFGGVRILVYVRIGSFVKITANYYQEETMVSGYACFRCIPFRCFNLDGLAWRLALDEKKHVQGGVHFSYALIYVSR